MVIVRVVKGKEVLRKYKKFTVSSKGISIPFKRGVDT